MRQEDILALAVDLERTDPGGWAQRVRNVHGDFVFFLERPEMAVPLRYIEHILAHGPRGRGSTLTDADLAVTLRQSLRDAGFRRVAPADAEFPSAFDRYLRYYQTGFAGVARGNPDSRERYRSKYVFWVQDGTRAETDGVTRDAVVSAMGQVSSEGLPEGFAAPRNWLVKHPETGEWLPAKAVWGTACGETGRSTHTNKARRGLEQLGFDLASVDQTASEIAESPESLEHLPIGFEGAERQVTRNIKERDPAARRAAEKYWRGKRGGALVCEGCDLDFARRYGPRGEGFMHFHHLDPLANAIGRREICGPEALVPLCPNCHAMVHRGVDLLSVEALREIIRSNKGGGKRS